ncbi:MAG TPA: serine/threonine-protein kinase, partial [Kofleriaceae bacterium]|nr:serine/threonine-protein kinase [Kofleriaceae bacterium]
MARAELSHYRILEALGQGAMGEVYRAVDQRLGRQVALKMLPADAEGDPDWQTRMLREAQAASALNHPGIVTLYDIATADGCSFLVMELVAGDKLSDLARRGDGLTWRRAVELTAGVAEALAAAHALGILHRDVKSDNVMVTPGGQVKVLDFGLAKLRSDPSEIELPEVARLVALEPERGPAAAGSHLAIDLTHHGQLVGTPAYMAPECYEGPADARSEVFSLGVVLHELLCGARPFDRGNAMATMMAIRADDPQPPSVAAPARRIPAEVDAVVARALAKQPADRYPDMAAFATALRALLRPPRRSRLPWSALAALALAGGATAWWLATRHRGAAGAPPAAAE